MLLLLASSLAWMLYFSRYRARTPSLRSIDTHLTDGTVTYARHVDDVPIGDSVHSYAVKYAVGREVYIARSTLLTWPIRTRRRTVFIEGATLDVADDGTQQRLDVTDRIRRFAGVNGDFHHQLNTLTWMDLLRCERGYILIALQRYRWYWPFGPLRSMYAADVHQSVLSIKPYVV